MTNEMTAEEAVKILRFEQEQVEHRLDGYSDTQENRNIYEAFRMAIKALEQGDVLDKMKAEIKEWYWQADKQALAKDPCVVDAMVDLFIRTIDKYKAESEDKV